MTKDFEQAWHSMLNLKYTSDFAKVTVQSMRKDRVMTVNLGMLHGHRTVIVVLRFWVTAR